MVKRTTRLQSKAQALCESDGSDLTDIEDVVPTIAQDVQSPTEVDDFDEDKSEVENAEDKPVSEDDSEDDYVAPGYTRVKAVKRQQVEQSRQQRNASGSDEEEPEPIKWTLEAPFAELSDEILCLIYSHLGGRQSINLATFGKVSQRFFNITQLASARAMWLMKSYGRASALYQAVSMGSIVDAGTLDYLIDVLGADASRYFFQLSCLAYTRRAPTWLGRTYCTPETIPFKNWLALLKKGCSMYPNMSPTTGKTDSEVLSAWIESQGTSAAIPKSRRSRRRRTYKYGYHSWEPVAKVSTVLKFDNEKESERVKEAEFEVIEDLFVTYKFAPFPSGRDPVGHSSTYAQAVAINPNFLQLVLDAGFKSNELFGEKVFQNILGKSNWSPEDKVDVFENLYLLHPELKPTADYFEKTVLGGLRGLNQVETMTLLDQQDEEEGRLFDFSIADLIPKFLASLARSWSSSVEANFATFHLLKAFEPAALDAKVQLVCVKVCLALVKADKPAKARQSSIFRHYRQSTEELEAIAEKEKMEKLSLSAAMELMDTLKLHLSFDDCVRLLGTFGGYKLPVALDYVKQVAADEWQDIFTIAACSLLWCPDRGSDLSKILDACPEAKNPLRDLLLSEFYPDCDKLAKLCHPAYGGRGRWTSPFMEEPGMFWNMPDVFHKPDSIDSRVQREQQRTAFPGGESKQVTSIITSVFADDQQIQQLYVLYSALHQVRPVVHTAVHQKNIAISLELFELLAAADVPPLEVLFEATIKSPFILTHAEAVEMLEPGNPDASDSEIEHLDAWARGFNQILMKKVDYLDMSIRPNPATSNAFVLTLVEWKQAFEDASASLV